MPVSHSGRDHRSGLTTKRLYLRTVHLECATTLEFSPLGLSTELDAGTDEACWKSVQFAVNDYICGIVATSIVIASV
jgi:hypothetical protein